MIKQPKQTTSTVQTILQSTFGPQLMALYDITNSNPTLPDLNLLAIIKKQDIIHQIRQALHQSNHTLPLIATPATLTRHLHLNPTFANHLAQNGRLLSGQQIEITQTPIPTAEETSLIASVALKASTALAPQLLPDHQSGPSQTKLQQIAAYLNLKPTTTSSQTIAAIYKHLAQRIANQPQAHWQIPAPTGAPPLIDALVAIYEHQNRVIFMLPDWPPNKIETYINQLNWTAVAASLKGQYDGLHITTPSLFRLMLRYTFPADHLFRNYNHAWGINAHAALEIPPSAIYRDLARFASNMTLQHFPQAYITAQDHQLDQLIHDYQNKLLNIQLRQELLHRLNSQPNTTPAKRITSPIPLPDRADPPTKKVDILLQQFNWWADHYTQEMDNT